MKETLLWTLITIVGTVGAVAIGLILMKLNKLIASRCEGFHSPQLSFRYTANDVNQLVENLKQVGALLPFNRFSQLMTAMMAEVLLVLLTVAHNIAHIAWIQTAMYALSGVIWLLGTAETLILQKKPALASVLSIIKWGAFGIWTLGMFAALFIRSTVY